MNNEYLIVSKKILPEELDKVLLAKKLLENHEVKSIKEACDQVGISRNTYYKYKDVVYAPNGTSLERYAVISLVLKDENGALSAVINCLAANKTSILTISQALPIGGKANVLISLEISEMSVSMDELLLALQNIEAVKKIELNAIT